MRWLRLLGIYALLSGFLAGMLLLQAFPARPRTTAGWILLFGLALPVTLAGELIGDKVLNNRLGTYVEARTADQPLSLVRIGFALVALIIYLAVVAGVYAVWHDL